MGTYIGLLLMNMKIKVKVIALAVMWIMIGAVAFFALVGIALTYGVCANA